VVKFSIDWDLIFAAHQQQDCGPDDHFGAMVITILSANLSFCQMSQYQEVFYFIPSNFSLYFFCFSFFYFFIIII